VLAAGARDTATNAMPAVAFLTLHGAMTAACPDRGPRAA